MSWQQSRQGADLPDSKGAEEPAVVELKDGSLLAMLRTSLRKGYDSAYPSVTFVDDEVFVTFHSNVRSGIVGIVSEVKLKIFPAGWFYPNASD